MNWLPCTELRPDDKSQDWQPSANGEEAKGAPWAKGGAPDPLPSKDGSPLQQNRPARGQKAN